MEPFFSKDMAAAVGISELQRLICNTAWTLAIAAGYVTTTMTSDTRRRFDAFATRSASENFFPHMLSQQRFM